MSAVPKGEIEAQVRGNQMWWSQETQRSLSHPAEGFLGPWANLGPPGIWFLILK